ncbi:MAG: hypothetical protein IJD14_04895 [Christensenellaceae bacterium]|nr:hypothetical protein [Christensenellaceae bacterium]
MGAFTDKKLTNTDFEGKNIKSISGNTVVGKAEELKALFDRPAQEVVAQRLNQLLDLLESSEAAENIGIEPLHENTGTTLRAQLLYLESIIGEMTLGQIMNGSITDAKLSDADNAIKARVQAIYNDLENVKGTTSGSAAHLLDSNNPHNVTAEQVGAASPADIPVSMSAAEAQQIWDTHITNDADPESFAEKLDGHVASRANPHGVTAEQVGLGKSTGVITAGILAWSGDNTCVERYGNIVCLYINGTITESLNSTATKTLLTIPEGFRPKSSFIKLTSIGRNVVLRVNTDGTVTAQNNAGSTIGNSSTASEMFTYFVN